MIKPCQTVSWEPFNTAPHSSKQRTSLRAVTHWINILKQVISKCICGTRETPHLKALTYIELENIFFMVKRKNRTLTLQNNSPSISSSLVNNHYQRLRKFFISRGQKQKVVLLKYVHTILKT